MNTAEKHALARYNDDSAEASGHRLKAARLSAGLSQEAFGKNAGVGRQAVNNAEKGRSFPSRAMMHYLFSEHRIDYNFMIIGHYAQLPGDVQDRLFAALNLETDALDREDSSG